MRLDLAPNECVLGGPISEGPQFMIVVKQHAGKEAVSVYSKGNFSLGAEGLVLVVLALAVVTLSMAVLLTVLGYWPILLIAVLQLVLVSWILIRAWRQAWIVERVEVDCEHIRVVRKRFRRTERYSFSTAWTAIALERPRHRWHAPRLWLQSKGVRLELGAFLNQEERVQLYMQLRELVSPHNAWR
jgi:uncharacterized membrane protein